MIQGKQIILRPLKDEDAVFVSEMRTDWEGNLSFIGSPFPSNIHSETEWIKNMYKKGLSETIYFALVEIKSNNFIGYAVARKIDYINSHAEVGIFINKSGRGKGYFYEISDLFYKYLFNTINLQKLYSYVLCDNEKAFNADIKIGFEVEGTIKKHIFQNGVNKDVFFMSLFREKYLAEHK